MSVNFRYIPVNSILRNHKKSGCWGAAGKIPIEDMKVIVPNGRILEIGVAATVSLLKLSYSV